jgi:hypothetical protein
VARELSEAAADKVFQLRNRVYSTLYQIIKVITDSNFDAAIIKISGMSSRLQSKYNIRESAPLFAYSWGLCFLHLINQMKKRQSIHSHWQTQWAKIYASVLFEYFSLFN